MNHNTCPYNHDKPCPFWSDYQLCQFSLIEAEELSHENWLEIRQLQERIRYLELLLEDAGVHH